LHTQPVMVSPVCRVLVFVSFFLTACSAPPPNPCPSNNFLCPPVWSPGQTITSYTLTGAVGVVRPDGSTLDWSASVQQYWPSLATTTNYLVVFLDTQMLGGTADPSDVAYLQIPMTASAPNSDWILVLCPHANDTLDYDPLLAVAPTCTTANGSTVAPLQVPLVGTVQTPQPPSTLDVTLAAPAGSGVTLNLQVGSEPVTTGGQCIQPRDCL
jgi:hypothetical protein